MDHPDTAMQAEQTPDGLRYARDGETVELTWYGEDILRVRSWRGKEPQRPSLSVVAAPSAPAEWQVSRSGDGVELRGPRLTARLDVSGAVSFHRGGRCLLREKPGSRQFPANDLPNLEDRVGVAQTFLLDATDALYGLGQFPNGVMNWRGHELSLIHGNVTVPLPFLTSTGGWGLLWDNASHSQFRDGPEGMTLHSEVADGLDYYVCAGDSMDEVIAGYRQHRLVVPADERPTVPVRVIYGHVTGDATFRLGWEIRDVPQPDPAAAELRPAPRQPTAAPAATRPGMSEAVKENGRTAMSQTFHLLLTRSESADLTGDYLPSLPALLRWRRVSISSVMSQRYACMTVPPWPGSIRRWLSKRTGRSWCCIASRTR